MHHGRQPNQPLSLEDQYRHLAQLSQQRSLHQHATGLTETVDAGSPSPRLTPKQQPLHFALGQRLLHAGEADDAVVVFQRLCQSNSFNADYWYYLGVAYEKCHHHQASKQAYERALKVTPSHVEAGFALGVLLEEADELETAMLRYHIVLKSCPNHAPAQNNLASCALQLGQYSLAERYFKAVLETFPELAKAMLGLALANDGLGKERQALWWYRNYLHRKPASQHGAFVQERIEELQAI
ncbi:MAG: tetratricopeptide repeat protein [Vampirovibrionales bacterium]